MKRFLSHPAINAICLAMLSTFYAVVTLLNENKIVLESTQYYDRQHDRLSFIFEKWTVFLSNGYLKYLIISLIALTTLAVIMLLFKKHSYDEYHVKILEKCLITALILTIISIGIFYLTILVNPDGIIVKFTLFAMIHWMTIILADLFYVFKFNWR